MLCERHESKALTIKVDIQWQMYEMKCKDDSLSTHILKGSCKYRNTDMTEWEKWHISVTNHVTLSHSHITEFLVILRATLYWNSNSLLPLNHVRFQDPYFISITFLISILSLNLDSIFRTPYAQPSPTLPIPYLFSIYSGWGFRNPVSDLLIPLPCPQPCIVPSSYKSEPPMYCRPMLSTGIQTQ